mgnify:CR=1 FL=1
MSRAFVKEGDGDDGNDLPERPVPTHANYVTARGLAQLQARAQALAREHEMLTGDDPDVKRRRREVERDQRYVKAQLERAQRVEPDATPSATLGVRFGDTVEVADEHGERLRYRIVGDDEADAAHGDISWASPLGKALLGARVGDVVTWRRPMGAVEIEVISCGVDVAKP